VTELQVGRLGNILDRGRNLLSSPLRPRPNPAPYRRRTAGKAAPGRKADHSPPTSAGLKNVWSYTSTPNVPSRLGT
jgi:hypothetical protein